MANEIPSSAIKLFTAETGGNEVNSGTNGATVVYPRIVGPFVEALTGSNISVGFPYYGRSALSGAKNLVCGFDIKPLTLNLPALGVIPIATQDSQWLEESDVYVSYTGETCDWNGGSPTFTSDSGRAMIGFYLNSSQVTINSTPTQFSVFSLKVNGQDATDGSAFILPNDIGRVKRYAVEIVFDIEANPTINSRSIGEFAIDTAEGTKTISMTQEAGSANLSLSVNNVNVDNTTGLSSTAVTVTANDNWTF